MTRSNASHPSLSKDLFLILYFSCSNVDHDLVAPSSMNRFHSAFPSFRSQSQRYYTAKNYSRDELFLFLSHVGRNTLTSFHHARLIHSFDTPLLTRASSTFTTASNQPSRVTMTRAIIPALIALEILLSLLSFAPLTCAVSSAYLSKPRMVSISSRALLTRCRVHEQVLEEECYWHRLPGRNSH